MGMYRYKRAMRKGFPFAMMMGAGQWNDFGRDGPFGRGGPFGPGGPNNRRKRGRVFGQGELRLTLLMLIGDEPRHGYELIKAIGEMTGGTYEPSPGAVYPTLQLLADEGVIKQAKPKKGEEAKKAFEITEAGTEELAEREDETAKLIAKLTAMSGREDQTRAPEFFRAMGNLATVLKNRYRSGDYDEKTVQEVVDIIDDAAKRIERL